jgi:DNA-binding transcriptional MerR regulator
MIQKEMAEDKVNSDKIYYRISEIADMFGVNVSLLRYWEKEFPQIKPKTNSRGVRLYKQADIDIIALIFHLVKERGMTLDGRPTQDEREQGRCGAQLRGCPPPERHPPAARHTRRDVGSYQWRNNERLNTTISMSESIKSYRPKEYGQPVKRYCQTLDLRDDPQLIAEYRRRHQQENAWPRDTPRY